MFQTTQFLRPLTLAFLVQMLPAMAGLVVHDSRYDATLRHSGSPQAFPLAIDANSGIFSVSGTSTNADFFRINTDASITTLNSAVGQVVGVLSDLEVGFDGDLFANAAQLPTGAAGKNGVIRFNSTTGTASSFYSASGFNADGGLAFDAANQVLYSQSQIGGADLISLNASGTATTVASGLGSAVGLALENSGTLLTANGTLIRRVDPGTGNLSTVLDFNALIPDFIIQSVDVLAAGEIIFTAANNSAQQRRLYSVGSDGTGLNLIASDDGSWGPLQVAVGLQSDGLGESIYISDPNNMTVHELSAVPEPSAMGLSALVCLFGLLHRRRLRG